MNVLSLFDGISCGRLALQRAGIKIDKYYASEIDKYAIKITQKNFPETIQLGDVNNFEEWDLPQIDLLIGGSPCQDLSIAKQDRKGLEGERSGLFWRYVDCLHKFKPKYFLLENVASMPKEAKETITKTLGVEPILINSALVSAQQRKRLYWTNIPNVYLPIDKFILLKDVLCKTYNKYDLIADPIIFQCSHGFNKGGVKSQKSPTLTANGYYEQNNFVCQPIKIGEVDNGGQGNRVYSVQGKSICLNANSGGKGSNTGLYKIELPDGDYIIRKLYPIECERLQTLPDNYTLCDGVSNTQRYKCIGNAWTVDVIAHIFKNLF